MRQRETESEIEGIVLLVEKRPDGTQVVKAVTQVDQVVLVCANCGETRGSG